MQPSSLAFFVTIFIVLCIETDASLQCYTCAGTCSAKLFTVDHHRVSTCPNTTKGCYKYVLNNDGAHSTYRGCARLLHNEFCSAVKPFPGTRMYSCSVCDTPLCNTAEHRNIDVSLYLLCAALTILLQCS